jgi:hypothetical protein
MKIDYRYTSHQVVRGARADAELNDTYFLLKNVSLLRLTYQIRLLAFRAKSQGRKLIIRVPTSCQVHPALRDFQKAHNRVVRIEKV